MAPRAPRVCSRCNATATHGNRCAEHREIRPSAWARGYDKRWRQTRAVQHLSLEPWCRECLARGEHMRATEVDHIDGLGPLAPRGHDHANLRSLCKPHHSSVGVNRGRFGASTGTRGPTP
jgi:5-methylcytosine-specific restriction protein A